MPGSDAQYSGGGPYDLLRQATQAMMSSSKKVTNDDDGADHIESDTPRSGIATPVPDPSDKRLPGIMHTDSYFNQVGASGSSAHSDHEGALETPDEGSKGLTPFPHHTREFFVGINELVDSLPDTTQKTPTASGDTGQEAAHLVSERASSSAVPSAVSQLWSLHPYPTPPTSGPPSVHKLKISEQKDEAEEDSASRRMPPPAAGPVAQRQSVSDPSSRGRRASMLTPLSSIVTTSNVHAAHFSNPSDRSSIASPVTPSRSRIASIVSSHSASYEKLHGLTDGANKSQPGTPTRALSNQTAISNESGGNTSAPASVPSHSSNGSGSAAAKGVRGKLVVKIVEARNIRRSKDPYVVAIFQRNELVSKGPKLDDDEDEDFDMPMKNPMGGIPISRQGSESGRSMAIPMKSRQSSSTSLEQYRSRPTSQKPRTASFTAPRWDTEAIFDVVGDDTHLSVSIYDRGTANEDFLGMVVFNQTLDENLAPIQGWFPLHGRKNTEGTGGEIYVEMTFQRTEKKHYGPEDFDILKLIGKGTFGQVYQVRKKDTKRIYAMKVLQKKVIVQKKEVAHTVGERNILVRTAMADSPFIVGLKFSFQTPTDLYLVTDYMSGGELFWHLQKEGRFDERRAKFYIAELILALQHLHAHDIVYRDLKPENILLDANGHIALCDFGLSKANLTKNDTTNTFCGTTEYLAPEVLLDEQGYTKMVDFWSLGVLVFEMCCGWSPFYAEDTQQMYKNIAFGKVRFPRDTLTTEGRNFVKGLLNRNPKHRLGATDDAEELKQHPFFADIDWIALTNKQILPPFKPKLKSETDVSNFDPEFTNALTGASSLNARAAALAAGVATSTPLSPGMQANFKGFTFVDESSIDDHMRDHIRRDYDDMDEGEKRETDWEEPTEPSRNREDRMSGVVKTNTNEDQTMFNGGDFDM